MDAPRRASLTVVPGLDYAALIAFLEAQSDVAAAYLFGSLAQGRAAPGSDIDLAILLRPLEAPVSLERRLQLMEGVERCAERRVNVVTLNDAPLLLQREVLQYGRLLCDRDRAVRVEFEVRTGKRDADLAPMRAFFAQALFQEIRDGRFGQRRLVLERLIALRNEIAYLRSEAGDVASVQAYAGNMRLKRAVERSLQVAVEICLDIGRRIIALEGLRYPADNQDVFRILIEAHITPDDMVPTLLNMARFRNLIIREYARIDDAQVYAILQQRLSDFDAFTDVVRRYVQSS